MFHFCCSTLSKMPPQRIESLQNTQNEEKDTILPKCSIAAGQYQDWPQSGVHGRGREYSLQTALNEEKVFYCSWSLPGLRIGYLVLCCFNACTKGFCQAQKIHLAELRHISLLLYCIKLMINARVKGISSYV